MIRTIFVFLFFLYPVACQAISTIIIDQGHVDPIPLAINHFDAQDKMTNKIGNDIIEVIANDLRNSGLFRTISAAAFIEKKQGINHKPLFAAWRQINASLLLNGEIKQISSDKIKVSFIVWDTILEKNIVAEALELPTKLWRRVAHQVADRVYEKLTGNQGYFDTQIAYISETGPYLKRVKRLAIMDQDGANHQYLTDGKNLVLTPRFSPHADKLLYISYAKKIPRIFIRNLRTGKDSLLGNFPGMSFAPCFSPDGSKALISIARHGSTHIFSVDLRTMHISPLTFGPGINTSPSYSPTGDKIVFNSDRSGSRQLYIMNPDGSNMERISFGGGSYTTPVWSPHGNYIAFTKISPGEGFGIGVMRPNIDQNGNNDERIIARGYLVEGPTWAANGKLIMFTKASSPKKTNVSQSRIYTIDLNGYNEREIPTPKDASDPNWSKLLQ